MANLQLNIEVNDEEFKDLCANNINSLPKDKLNELLLKAVEVALISDKTNPSYDRDSNILVRATSDSAYGYYNRKYEPTELLKSIVEKVDLSEYIGNMANIMRDYIVNNYEEIIRKYVVEKFAEMLFTSDNQYAFRSSIMTELNQIIRSK